MDPGSGSLGKASPREHPETERGGFVDLVSIEFDPRHLCPVGLHLDACAAADFRKDPVRIGTAVGATVEAQSGIALDPDDVVVRADVGALDGIQTVVSVVMQNTVIEFDIFAAADLQNVIVASFQIHPVNVDVRAATKGDQIVIVSPGPDSRVPRLVSIDMETADFDVGTRGREFLDHGFVLGPSTVAGKHENGVRISFENRLSADQNGVGDDIGERPLEVNRGIVRIIRHELQCLVDLDLVGISVTDVIPGTAAARNIHDRGSRRKSAEGEAKHGNTEGQKKDPFSRPVPMRVVQNGVPARYLVHKASLFTCASYHTKSIESVIPATVLELFITTAADERK